jgi:hypothetical protein
MKKAEQPANPTLPKWLDRLQQRSWEPEILLSGIVLFGLFKTPALLDQFLAYFKLHILANTQDIDNAIALTKVAVYWLTFGLMTHLICRGIWVGMVGLSFTFPKGIDFQRLKLAPKFEASIKKIPSIQDIVIKLERLCSSLFATSFLLFMVIIGGYLYLLLLIVLPIYSYMYAFDVKWTAPLQKIFNTYGNVIIGIGAMGLLDFITLGFFKRIKWLSNIYWPVYRVIQVLSLAKFYRPIYYVLISNLNKWKMALALTFFLVVSLVFTNKSANARYPGDILSTITVWNTTQGTSSFQGYYDDQNAEYPSVRAHIQSDILSGNTIRLFIVSRADTESLLRKFCERDTLDSATPLQQANADLKCVTAFYTVLLDEKPVETLTFKFHYKTATKQKGILTYIDITDLPAGLHELAVETNVKESYESTNRIAQIPFYRER